MDQNTRGIIYSFVFVFAVIIVATVLQIAFKLSKDFSRKIIHVAVGNWIYFALFYFNKWYFAIIGPVSFIFLNFLSYKYNIFKAMELEEKNPGTVYYAVSLTICTLFTFSKTPPLVLPFLGIMAMTWGDGLAAVVGKKFPIRQLWHGKSLGGSLAFFIFTLGAALVYLKIFGNTFALSSIVFYSLGTAVFGFILELYSPKNSDNLTVPIILGLIGFLIGM